MRGELRPGLRRRMAAAALSASLAAAFFTGIEAAVQYTKTIADLEVLVVTPDRQPDAAALVLALHGCRQSAAGFLEAGRLAGLIDRHGLVLALPQAHASGDNPLGCWQWWDPQNQRRGGPVPGSLAAIAGAMDVRIDPTRIYAMGLSSGGAMAAILGVVYPDLFSAVGVHSGVGFAAGGGTACALKVLRDVPDDAEDRGRLGYLHQTAHRVVPAVIIHGTDDDVVEPAHADGLVREIAQRNDFADDDRDNDSFDADPDSELDETGPCRAEEADDCHPYQLARYEDRDGNVMLERVLVEDLGHAWPGRRGGRDYADPRGPDAGELFWRFFKDHALDPDALVAADPPPCADWWAPPWWHYWWAGTMRFGEFTCDMNPWSMVWRHRIDGVSGPGRCP